jgi:hypothetical protein
LLLIGAGFAFVAGATTFLIMYREYIHHFADRREPLRISLQAAVVAFVFMFAMALVAGYALARYLM